jgi:hypothetical protein
MSEIPKQELVRYNWPPYLKTWSTRPSHIAILLVVIILFAAAIATLIWALYRSDGLSGNRPNNGPQQQLQLRAGSSKFNPIDIQLIDPGAHHTSGKRWITNGQSIRSTDGRFELGLTNDGNAELWDHTTETKIYESNTSNISEPANRLICGIDGFCYIILPSGAKATKKNTLDQFYISPNQNIPYCRLENGSTVNILDPFYLGFYKDGLVLYSTNFQNDTITGSKQNTRINLWWQSASGLAPEEGYSEKIPCT